MLKRLIYRLLARRHFWRQVGFDELSELYIGMMFRGMAIGMSGLFVPLFLIGLHYSVTSILMVMAWYFTSRLGVFDLLAGYMVARIGPKHGMFIGHIMLIASTALFLTLPHYSWPLWLLGGLWGGAQSFFFISFNVDFSKVKHPRHSGKEFGYITIMEKIGAVFGPLVGGVVATVFDPGYIFLLAIGLLLGGLLPLFRTAEPVRVKQRLDFRHFTIDGHGRDFLAAAGLGVENYVSLYLWPLFLGLFVLVGSTAYAKLGVLSSVSFAVSILAARVIGRLIDARKGRLLLRSGALANALLHLFRPFVSTFPIAFGVNLVNDAITPAYRMPYFKGLFNAADDLPGQRIAYITSIEIFGSLVKATMCWTLVILSLGLEPRVVLTVGFVGAAAVSLLITAERFRALGSQKDYNGA
jgi:MFS family permease